MWLIFALACSTPEPTAPTAHETPHEAPVTDVTAAHEDEENAGEATEVTPLNLNTATAEAIAKIPGMTPKMIHEFEEYRPYVSIAQFRKEIGKYVSEEQVAAWEPYVYVPVAPNDCDAATLAQLPGVDVAKAEALIAARPFADRDAFLATLSEQVGESEAEKGAPLVQ